MADLANPVRRVRCISIEQVKNCLAWLMVRSALRSAYYGSVPGDRAARGVPGSCPPTCWTPTDPELFCCRVVNLVGLSHSENAGMVPAGRHIEGTAKPPARWAKHSSAVFISGEPGEAFCGAAAAGRGTNINTKPPVNKAAGTSSCDPRTGLRDATLRLPSLWHRLPLFPVLCAGLIILHARTLEAHGTVWSY